MKTLNDLRPGKIFYLSMGEVKILTNENGTVKATLCGSEYCDSTEDLIHFINTHEVKGFIIVLTKDNLANKAGYVYTDYHYKHFSNNAEIYKLFSSVEHANICISQNHMETVRVEAVYVNPDLIDEDEEDGLECTLDFIRGQFDQSVVNEITEALINKDNESNKQN